jgi:hypothetical protein
MDADQQQPSWQGPVQQWSGRLSSGSHSAALSLPPCAPPAGESGQTWQQRQPQLQPAQVQAAAGADVAPSSSVASKLQEVLHQQVSLQQMLYKSMQVRAWEPGPCSVCTSPSTAC